MASSGSHFFTLLRKFLKNYFRPWLRSPSGFALLLPFLVVQVMEYWESDVVPDIRAGKRVLVVAHANTLRSLVKRCGR